MGMNNLHNRKQRIIFSLWFLSTPFYTFATEIGPNQNTLNYTASYQPELLHLKRNNLPKPFIDSIEEEFSPSAKGFNIFAFRTTKKPTQLISIWSNRSSNNTDQSLQPIEEAEGKTNHQESTENMLVEDEETMMAEEDSEAEQEFMERKTKESETNPLLMVEEKQQPKIVCKTIQSSKKEPLCLNQFLEELDIEKPKYDLPIYYNARVNLYIRLYTKRKRKAFIKGYQRSLKYRAMIHRIFKEHELPLDLTNLALVESNFNTFAVSKANAVGLWQFIASTGRSYDLHQSWWHDDRYDAEKSTIAAAKYLKKLYQTFGHWELALAAYNSGSGKVRREIRRAKAANKPTDFWALKLPRETRGYVPAFIAATIITKNLTKYGFKLEENYLPEEPKRKIEVAGGISLKQVAKTLNVSLQKLKKLNLGLRYEITPGNVSRYLLRVPGTGEISSEKLEELQKYKTQYWKVHKIKNGETLWRLSKKYKIPIKQILFFNRVKKNSVLKIGSKLMLPVPTNWRQVRKEAYKKGTNQWRIKVKRKSSRKFFHYKVKKGDTLWRISRRYDVPIRSLLSWNTKVIMNKILRIGTKIRIRRSG